MARVSPAGIVLFSVLVVTVFKVEADSGPLTKLRRQRRDWIIPPKKLEENREYTDVIAKIRSDEETRTSIKYSLEGHGASEEPFAVFRVNAANGDVTVHEILDREKISKYNLKGVAKFANGSKAEKDIDLVIYVTDKNDCSPKFTVIPPAAVNESSAEGTFVITVIATDDDDKDTPNAQISYSIINQIPEGNPMFKINQRTGAISVQRSTLDRELYDTYTLTIKAADMNGEGNSETATLVINILDINDNIPMLEKESYEGSIEENLAYVEVMRIKATDKDLINSDNWLAVFSIVSGNEAGYFKITTDKKTNEGIITIVKALDYEEIKELEIKVRVDNKAEYLLTNTEIIQKNYNIKIKVKNQPEGPVFKPLTKFVNISESKKMALYSVITRYHAVDGDTFEVAKNVRYVKGRDVGNWLLIDEKSAEIRINKHPDRESTLLVNGTYYAEILCITNDLPSKTSTGTIALHVEDWNDNCPELINPNQILCMDQKALYITAKDDDSPQNSAPFDFSVVPGEEQTAWRVTRVNGTTAALSSRDNLWPGYYEVAIDVRDQKGKACPSQQVVKFTVCTCIADEMCAARLESSSKVFGAPGVLLLLLGLLLLLLVPLLLLFCSCGGAGPGGMRAGFGNIPETKANLIQYNTEAQGEDKEVPLIKATIHGQQEVDALNKQWMTWRGAWGGARGGAWGGARGGAWGGAGAKGWTNSQVSEWEAGRHGMTQDDIELSNLEHRLDRDEAYDGIALSEAFLESYYLQKASSKAKDLYPEKNNVMVYEFEGGGSPAGSLGCCSFIEEDNDLEFLNDLGPSFKTLAEICTGSTIWSEGVHVSSQHVTDHKPVLGHTEMEGAGLNFGATRRETSSSSSTHTKSTVCMKDVMTTSLPSMPVVGTVATSNQTYLLQTQPMYIASGPVLQVMEPQVHNAMLVTERAATPSLQGMLLVQNSPASESILMKENHVVMGPALHGTLSRGENVFLVERSTAMGQTAEANRSLAQTGAMSGPGSQNVLVVEQLEGKRNASERCHVVSMESRGLLQEGRLQSTQGTQKGATSGSLSMSTNTGAHGGMTLLSTESSRAPSGGHTMLIQEKLSVTERSFQGNSFG